MVLLSALIHTRKILHFSLFVITVNHNIRPAYESRTDADFVCDFCNKNTIDCKVITFERGIVEHCTAERGRGTEEAARFLRYQAFERFITEKNLDLLCLGHTKSDQLETLLQRFLQGSSAFAMAGIQKKRELFYRPLLDFSREDILEYVAKKNVSFRTDETNNTTIYLRNKIRNILIPLLDEHFNGWQTGVLRSAKQNSVDAGLIEELADKMPWNRISETEVQLPSALFFEAHSAVQLKLLYRGANLITDCGRIPRVFFEPLLGTQKKLSGYGLKIIVSNSVIVIKKAISCRKHSPFFAIIEQSGFLIFSEFYADIREDIPRIDKNWFGPFNLPLIIRSWAAADTVKTACGGYKNVGELLADWKIPSEQRLCIPIIECGGEIMCVCGSFFGYADWYVKQTVTTEKKIIYIQFERIS